jgi:hypothetical protein
MAESISLREFNELITWRQPDRDKSSKGQVKETWTDYRKALVKIFESGNEEQKEGQRMNAPGVLNISGHYDSGVDLTFRVIWNNVEYAVTSITPVQNRRYMIVKAEKIFE